MTLLVSCQGQHDLDRGSWCVEVVVESESGRENLAGRCLYRLPAASRKENQNGQSSSSALIQISSQRYFRNRMEMSITMASKGSIPPSLVSCRYLATTGRSCVVRLHSTSLALSTLSSRESLNCTATPKRALAHSLLVYRVVFGITLAAYGHVSPQWSRRRRNPKPDRAVQRMRAEAKTTAPSPHSAQASTGETSLILAVTLSCLGVFLVAICLLAYFFCRNRRIEAARQKRRQLIRNKAAAATAALMLSDSLRPDQGPSPLQQSPAHDQEPYVDNRSISLSSIMSSSADTGTGPRRPEKKGRRVSFDSLVDVAEKTARASPRRVRKITPASEQILLSPPALASMRGFGYQHKGKSDQYRRTFADVAMDYHKKQQLFGKEEDHEKARKGQGMARYIIRLPLTYNRSSSSRMPAADFSQQYVPTQQIEPAALRPLPVQQQHPVPDPRPQPPLFVRQPEAPWKMPEQRAWTLMRRRTSANTDMEPQSSDVSGATDLVPSLLTGVASGGFPVPEIREPAPTASAEMMTLHGPPPSRKAGGKDSGAFSLLKVPASEEKASSHESRSDESSEFSTEMSASGEYS